MGGQWSGGHGKVPLLLFLTPTKNLNIYRGETLCPERNLPMNLSKRF